MSHNQRVIIGLIDSGFDTLILPELRDHLLINEDEIPQNDEDDDKDGFIDNRFGCSAINDGDPIDESGHGTQLLSIIAFLKYCLSYVQQDGCLESVKDDILLMPAKFINRYDRGMSYDVIRVLNWATEKVKKEKAKAIFNLSFTFDDSYEDINEALLRADDAGVILVSALGNHGVGESARPKYPAWDKDLFKNMITVAACDIDRRILPISNTHPQIADIAAFGQWKVIGRECTQYDVEGTSYAAIFVTYALALMLRNWDFEISPKDIITDFLDFADNIDALKPYIKNGRCLNLLRILQSCNAVV